MIELRRLTPKDLEAIERIEQRSYPTPWSRSMFASELAKPSSISLGAFEVETGELVGYLVISRYVDAWHVMNIAVAPDRRREGIAVALFERLFELTGADGRRGYTLEVRISNEAAIKIACKHHAANGQPERSRIVTFEGAKEKFVAEVAADLLEHDARLDMTHAQPAVGFGHEQAGEAHLGHLLPQRPRPPRRIVDELSHVRGRALLLQEAARLVALPG